MPDPEVPERPVRRRFTAEYKLRIVEQANAATEPGAGRRPPPARGPVQQPSRRLAPPVPRRRAQKSRPAAGATEAPPLVADNEQLRRRNARLARRLTTAERIIVIQGKVSELLGIPLAQSSDDDESGS
jgi:transposase